MDQPQDPAMLPPSKRTLTLQTAPELDNGKVAVAFNNAMRLATLDIIDRPNDKTVRKVILTAELRPILDKDTGVLDVIDNEFVVKKSFPVQRSAPYPMCATTDGQMIFDVGSPLDPRQQSFEYVDRQTGEVQEVEEEDEEGTM